MITLARLEAKKLSRITLITNFGDFLTYFSVVKLVYDIHGDAFSAAFGGVGLGSLAKVVSGLSVPYFKRYFNTKSLIVFSQWFNFIVVALLLYASLYVKVSNPWVFFTLLFFQHYLSQLFDSARETHSHALNEENKSHRTIQSLLMEGFYSAQFLGPLVAFFLLKEFKPHIPVFIDLLTFLVAGTLSLKLTKGPRLDEKLSAWRAFNYLKKNLNLRILFLLRTFGFWIPTAFVNMIIYENAVKRFQVGVEYSGVIYSVLGLGGIFGSLMLREKIAFFKLEKTAENKIASFAQFGMSLILIGMLISNNIIWGTFCYLMYGIAMGANAVSTQALRRSYCNKNQLPEVIGLEAMTSFGIQFLLTIFISNVWSKFSFALNGGLIFASIFLSITALVFRVRKF